MHQKIYEFLRIPNMCLFFSQAFILYSSFVIFRYIKVAKDIWEPCCQLVEKLAADFPSLCL